jgi:two-component sensor histidine kinase
VPAAAAQPLAMTFHEMATNAVKYGALSLPAGHIAVGWRLEGGMGDRTLRLRWTEVGGPPVTEAPTRKGFGSRVLEATVRGPARRDDRLRLGARGAGLRYRGTPEPHAGSRKLMTFHRQASHRHASLVPMNARG